MNDKRGAVTPERVALKEEAKRVRNAGRYVGNQKRDLHRRERQVLLAWVLFVVSTGGVLCGLASSFAAEEAPATPLAAVEIQPDIWATDGELPDAGPLIARPMPKSPFKGQKKPDPRTGLCGAEESNIVGACWVEVARKVGNDNCGPKFYQHETKCYLPVKEGERLPTSVMP